MRKIGENFPGQAMVVICDLCKDENLIDVKEAIIERFGGVDILINGAGKSRVLDYLDGTLSLIALFNV